jgi:hypothetical protein
LKRKLYLGVREQQRLNTAELDHPVFTSLDFATITEQGPSALRPTPNLEDQASAFMSPSDRVA